MDPSFLVQQPATSAFMSNSSNSTSLTALAKSLCQLCHKKIFDDSDQSIFKDIFPVRVECAKCGSVFHEKCLFTFGSVYNMKYNAKAVPSLKSCKECIPASASQQTETFRLVLVNNNNSSSTIQQQQQPSSWMPMNNSTLGFKNEQQQVAGGNSPVRPEDLSCTIM